MPIWIHQPTNRPIGYTDAGAGLPVVLVHPFPFCREIWANQVASLSTTNRVLTPDVFGFGESGLPAENWTVDSMADVFADWLLGIGVTGPVIFGGLSMGGYIALAFARRYPARVRGLILADTRADADPDDVKANREKTIAFVQQNRAVGLIEQMLPKLVSHSTQQNQPEVIETVKAMAGAQGVFGITSALCALRDRPDSTGSLRQFRFPVLLIVGAEDAITPPEMAHNMETELADVTLETLWSVGHLSNLEAPDEFNTAVHRWLEAIG
jgi:3-oxoadipate enol-lactonase